jgi:valyl-tRNA synthetase
MIFSGMELTKHYEPARTETKWYQYWLQKGYFKSVPDRRKAYTVIIPPPNVTGVLHMGHTLNETVQDILVRRARMSGFNACWVPGTDHASIATEARVVQMLKEKGIEKNSLSREAFLKYAYEWKEKYGGIIYQQIAKLGCSVDWDRVNFTMDDHYYAAVIKVFVDLYQKGLIYRGARMINWDPAARTALSDEEVEYRDVEGTLYYVKYPLTDDPSRFIVIATQRPETIMGDTAVCVNPADERYASFKGKSVLVPLVNRKVPVIYDDYIDISFGTGALKVTPAHDINDYNLGLKFGLPVIDTIREDGTLSEAAEIFVGMDRFMARKKMVEKLKKEGLLVKEESYATRLGYSQRSNAVVEPRISTQWFVNMKAMAEPALEQVMNGNIQIYPLDRFTATYKYWLENVKDWCISRQLWWGQRIPAWYDDNGNFVVAGNEQEALVLYRSRYGDPGNKKLQQDRDVLDTWFSSWLWPMEVFNGISQPGNADINYYYPATVLVTGQDIIFFWVARMIMAGMEYKKEKPFSDVYFTGMVRDKQGRKMSKSLGNSPDLLDLIDKYGADAVRFGILIAAPAGNDLLFDEAGLEQGRNFNNKIWNALKLIRGWQGRLHKTETGSGHFAVIWFENRLLQAGTDLEKMISQYRLSEALKYLYSLIWDDYCSWYLEWVKPGFEQNMPENIYRHTVRFFERLMQLLHPFMPFISEEIYHQLANRAGGDDLCIRQFETTAAPDAGILQTGADLQSLLTIGREFRQTSNMKNTEPIDCIVLPAAVFEGHAGVIEIIQKQLNGASISTEAAPETNGTSTTLPFKNHQVQFQTVRAIDQVKRKGDLEKELVYLQGFFDSLSRKLSNERFLQNAKEEVVSLETKKKNDTEAKIRALKESLASLQG